MNKPLSLMLLLFLALPAMAENLALPKECAAWTDADKEAQRQAGASVIKDLKAAAAKGDAVFTIPPGHYRFADPTRGFVILGFEKLNNLRIVAKGVTFWFEAWNRGLSFMFCKNLTIEGLTIDYDPVPYTQGTIDAVQEEKAAGKSYVEVVLDPGFVTPDIIAHDPVMNRKPDAMPMVIFDSKGERIKYNQWGEPNKIEALSATRYRIYTTPPSFPYPNPRVFSTYSDYGIQKGDRFALLHRLNAEAVGSFACENLQLIGVTVYACAGLNLIESRTEKASTYRDCHLVRRPGTKRLFAGNCDGINSAYPKEGPKIENCEMAYIGDDYINIWGSMGVVLGVGADPKTLFVASRSGFQADHLFAPGVRFTLVDRDSGAVKQTVTASAWKHSKDATFVDLAKRGGSQIRSLIWENSGNNVVELTLDQPAVNVGEYDYYTLPDFSGKGFVVKNCKFGPNLAGFRIQAVNGVIEGNSFTGMCLSMGISGLCQWLEGTMCHDILIRNNTFTDCQTGVLEKAAPFGVVALISVALEPRLGVSDLFPAPFHYNLTFESNTLIRPVCGAFSIANASNVVIRNNRIIEPSYRMWPNAAEKLEIDGNIGIVIMGNCDQKTVKVEGNVFEKKPQGFPGELFRQTAPAAENAPATAAPVTAAEKPAFPR